MFDWLRPARTPRRGRAPHLEALEDRSVPAGLFVTGVGGLTQATDPEVSIYASVGPSAGKRLNNFQAEAFSGVTGDTRVALGDVNGDGTDDLIAGAGFGALAEVVVFDGAAALRGTTRQLARFTAYDDFQGGVNVAAGDLDHDGHAEVMVTPGMGGRGHLKVFDFSDSAGRFTATPSLLTSAYTYSDYNGEVRVTALQFQGQTLVVTASGAGVPGDVRAYQNAHLIGSLADGTAVPSQFLVARLVPFGGYSGGLSVATGDVDGDGDGELFLAKNDGAPMIEVYSVRGAADDLSLGAVTLSPDEVITNVFPGFTGAIRLGSADLDGDGRDEVLATTGVSGDPKGTPVKAFAFTNSAFAELPGSSFYANPGYSLGAWLASKDFVFAQDFASPTAAFPAAFGAGSPKTVGLPSGTGTLPSETVTGANLPIRDVEVRFAFAHAVAQTVTVSLRYVTSSGATSSFLLFDGSVTPLSAAYSSVDVTVTDNASTGIGVANPVSTALTGRFRAQGGSLAAFFGHANDPNGQFQLTFADSRDDSLNGQISAAPTIRVLY